MSTGTSLVSIMAIAAAAHQIALLIYTPRRHAAGLKKLNT